MPARVACVGGAILDRKLALAGPVVLGSSNPVVATSTAGGVARNVAENLARLGHPVSFVGAVGDDGVGRELLASFPPGVDVAGSSRVAGYATAEYQAVLSPGGDLVIGLVEGSVLDRMDGPWIRERADRLLEHEWVVIDTNPTPEGIAAAIGLGARRRVVIATVSVAKISRLPQRLDGVTLLVCNGDEARALTGSPDPEAIRALGVEVAVVTHGADPAVLAWGTGVATVDAIYGGVIDVTGAGDSMLAGVISALSGGAAPADAVRFGHGCASLTIEATSTVRSDLSCALVEERVRR
jgi:pseudouridine kinase